MARIWERLDARIDHAGVDPVIAATELDHGATVEISNTGDFALKGAALDNPPRHGG